MTSISYNVAGILGEPETGQVIADELAALHPDFVGMQECDDGDALLARLPAGYALVDGYQDSELAIVYASDRWDVADHGRMEFGNDDGWGMREAAWARMRHVPDDSEVTLYTTHLCVSIRTPNDPCDANRQLEYVRKIVGDIESRGGAAVLGGDLNVFDGFESGPVISYLTQHGMVDTLRQITSDPVTTFDGNSWAPAGRIDYLFTTSPVDVLAASVGADSVSDHRLVAATVTFE